MLPKEKPLKHWIDHFYGYGSWHARFWFVSHEEGGGDLPEEVAEKVNYFFNVHGTAPMHQELCDIRALYRQVGVRWESPKAGLYANHYDYRFGIRAVQHGIWKNLIAFVHGYKNQPLPDVLAYQKQTFALPSATNEALIRLYPLPAPHNHGWYYSWLDCPELEFLKSRKQYQQHVYQGRIRKILSNVATFKPQIVVMYGMENINMLKESVRESFDGVVFKTVKATQRKVPQHHYADLHGTRLLITTQIPALRHQRIETGFDWEEFGKRVA